MSKPDIMAVLGLGAKPGSGAESEDGKPSDEENHQAKLNAANELLAAFHGNNAEKLVDAFEVLSSLCEPEESGADEPMPDDHGDEEEETAG